MHRFIPRIVGAAWLSALTYEEVEADSTATVQALLVVALSSVSAGLGVLRLGGGRPGVIIFVSVLAFAGWAVWALLTLHRRGITTGA
jgi:hypothetical protein